MDKLGSIIDKLASPEWLGFILDIFAIGSILFTLYQVYKGRKEARLERERNAQEANRLNQPIQIILAEINSARKICLPNPIRRGEISRGEVLGRIGMIPIKSDAHGKPQRFDIKNNAATEFIRNIDMVSVSSTEKTLTVACEKNEMNQFDIKEIKKLDFGIIGFD